MHKIGQSGGAHCARKYKHENFSKAASLQSGGHLILTFTRVGKIEKSFNLALEDKEEKVWKEILVVFGDEVLKIGRS